MKKSVEVLIKVGDYVYQSEVYECKNIEDILRDAIYEIKSDLTFKKHKISFKEYQSKMFDNRNNPNKLKKLQIEVENIKKEINNLNT